MALTFQHRRIDPSPEGDVRHAQPERAGPLGAGGKFAPDSDGTVPALHHQPYIPSSPELATPTKTNVYFTVDTEASMGGAWEDPRRRPVPAPQHVFCYVGGRPFGIPLIVEMMANYGLRATYFVETLATRVLGQDDTSSIFDFLLKQEQDVQLHLHPGFRYYAEQDQARIHGRDYYVPGSCDLLGKLPEAVQSDLLCEAAETFVRFVGQRPSVFRAGNYAGSQATMRCLARLGIFLDSSFNPCYPAVSFPNEHRKPNTVSKVEGVWEIPVAVGRTPLPEGYNGFKLVHCRALSFAEIRTLLESAAGSDMQHFVIVFHSFSAVKAKDVGYCEMRPNRIVIRRLEKLFQYLAENSDRFRVTTMGETAANLDLLEASSQAIVPKLGFVQAGVRKAVQLANRLYWL
jgi:hypothetical protein